MKDAFVFEPFMGLVFRVAYCIRGDEVCTNINNFLNYLKDKCIVIVLLGY